MTLRTRSRLAFAAIDTDDRDEAAQLAEQLLTDAMHDHPRTDVEDLALTIAKGAQDAGHAA